MYKLVIEYIDDQDLSDNVRSHRTFQYSSMLVDYEAYGCCLDCRTIMFDCDDQRTIAMLVIGGDPCIKRLRLG